MCYSLYLSTSSSEDLAGHNSELLRLARLDGTEPEGADLLRNQERWYVGSKSGCSCTFRHLFSVELGFGEPVDWFFTQWVYGTETPHYQFRYQLKDGGAGKTILQVSLTQSAVSDSFFMRVPLYVHIQGQPRLLGYISVRGTTPVNAEMPLPFRPEKVTIDETGSILCTIDQ